MEESSGYQLIMERGERKALISTILDLGQLKFGEPEADQVSTLQGIKDLGRLKELLRRRDVAATWEDLLA